MHYEPLVSALYHVFLGRKPDEVGLKSKVELLETSKAMIEEILEQFLQSNEFKTNRNQFMKRYRLGSLFMKSVSQHYESEQLVRHIVNSNFKHRIVVDVGARGRERSNSFDLMKSFGWKWLMVEANPGLLSSINADFTGLDYELLQVAVSDYDGVGELTIGANDDVSSLSADTASAWGGNEWLRLCGGGALAETSTGKRDTK